MPKIHSATNNLAVASEPHLEDGDRLILWPELHRRIPLSRVAVWEARRRGAFPLPVRVAKNRIAWKLSEVNAWINSREVA